jgi:hypothetical protein
MAKVVDTPGLMEGSGAFQHDLIYVLFAAG